MITEIEGNSGIIPGVTMRGDVDLDGNLDMDDVNMLEGYLNGEVTLSPEAIANAGSSGYYFNTLDRTTTLEDNLDYSALKYAVENNGVFNGYNPTYCWDSTEYTVSITLPDEVFVNQDFLAVTSIDKSNVPGNKEPFITYYQDGNEFISNLNPADLVLDIVGSHKITAYHIGEWSKCGYFTVKDIEVNYGLFLPMVQR